MKPHRVRMTHNLVVNYGLYRQMEVFRPKPISSQHMTRFHSDDYINFLRVITQDNMQVWLYDIPIIHHADHAAHSAWANATICRMPSGLILPQLCRSKYVASSVLFDCGISSDRGNLITAVVTSGLKSPFGLSSTYSTRYRYRSVLRRYYQ